MKEYLFEVVETFTGVVEAETVEEAQKEAEKYIEENDTCGLGFEGTDIKIIGLVEE